MSYTIRAAGLCLGALLALGACDKMKEAGTAGEKDVNTASNTLSKDSCGAAERQILVGQSASVLDPATLPAGTRVIFPGMAVTMDLRQERLNIEVGGKDKIARVFCG